MKNLWQKLITVIVSLYCILALFIFTPYYNWQYAKTNGFIKWLLLGEVVSTLKAFVWPYFLMSSNENLSTDTISHFKNAMDYSRQATAIINRIDSKLATQDEEERLIDLYSKTLSEAKQVDITLMNKHYPNFGDHFQREFIKGVELFLQGYQSGDPKIFIDGQNLIIHFEDWFHQHYDEIRKKV